VKKVGSWLSTGLLGVVLLAAAGCQRDTGPKIRTTDLRLPTPGGLEGSAAYIDAKNGFRELRFGGPVTPDMQLSTFQDYEHTKSYVRPGDSKQVSEAEVDEIRYVFYEGGLTTVVIESGNAEASEALLRELRSAYGPSEQPDDAMTQRWAGDKVVAYYRQEPTGEGKVVLWSRDMIDRLKKGGKAPDETK
jgi:hypothetical protein